MSDKIRTRFAPSPTGYLHVGNVRAALFCFLFAKSAGGEFVLRLDDTDAARSTDAFAVAIKEDLAWLGLVPDEVAKQSDRFARYAQVFAELKSRGLVYAAYETPDELERKRKRQLSRGQPPLYDRAALALSDAERAALEAEGRTPHWRFKLSGERRAWHDLVRGEQDIDTASLSDPVLLRGDGTWLYTLPSVVDDIDMNITHIIRGEDHVSNTAVQLELLAALGADEKTFAHFSLMTAAGGEGLSKREGSQGVRDIREQGFEPMSLLSLLARLGTADAVAAVADLQTLIAGFDIARLGRAPARFDDEDVARLNAQLLHAMPFAVARERLAAIGAPLGENFWEGVRGNLAKFSDVETMAELTSGEVAPVIDDAEYIAAALAALPPAPLTPSSWKEWTSKLKEQTDRKGRELFMPLRLALTGREDGPEMKILLPLIAYDKIVLRLKGEKG